MAIFDADRIKDGEAVHLLPGHILKDVEEQAVTMEFETDEGRCVCRSSTFFAKTCPVDGKQLR
jgi:hypothetical protein